MIEKPNNKNEWQSLVVETSNHVSCCFLTCFNIIFQHDQRVINPFNDKHTKLYAYEPLHPPTNSSQEKPLKTTQFFRRKTTSDLHDTSRPIITDTNTKLAPLGDGSKTSSIKGSYSSSTKGGAKTRASFPIGYHLTYTCSICVQAKPIKQLLQHYECGKVFCLECLEVLM